MPAFSSHTLRGRARLPMIIGQRLARRRRPRSSWPARTATSSHASHLELGADLKAGDRAVDLATRLTDGSSLMAATAARRSEHVNELNYALFTPCPLCDAAGNPEGTPALSVQAEKARPGRRNCAPSCYRNAVFKVGGVPDLLACRPLPIRTRPSTGPRASSIPNANYDRGARRLGRDVPYLQVVSPSEDWLISPQINTGVAPRS